MLAVGRSWGSVDNVKLESDVYSILGRTDFSFGDEEKWARGRKNIDDFRLLTVLCMMLEEALVCLHG